MICNKGICVIGICNKDKDCGSPAACIEGFCDLNCLKDFDCPDGLICKNSRCIKCKKNSDCEQVICINQGAPAPHLKFPAPEKKLQWVVFFSVKLKRDFISGRDYLSRWPMHKTNMQRSFGLLAISSLC